MIQLPDHDHVHCEECIDERMKSLAMIQQLQQENERLKIEVQEYERREKLASDYMAEWDSAMTADFNTDANRRAIAWIITRQKEQIADLTAENKQLKVKCQNSLANNLCPDHRDKQSGKPCLACEIETLTVKLEAAERENTERTSVAKLKAIDWRKLQDRILEQADRIRTLESALRCPQNAPIYLHFCTYCDSTLANWHQSKAAQEKKVTP